MEYKVVLILLVLGATIFSGCVDNPGKTVYVNKKDNHSIVLFDDKTFTYTENAGTFSGTYRIDGDHVILTFVAFGLVLDLKKEGNKLISQKDGTTWEKV